jgi:hypothetical protein
MLGIWLERDPSRLLVIEDPVTKPPPLGFEAEGLSCWHHGDEVYYAISAPAGASVVSAVINEVTTWTLVGYLVDPRSHGPRPATQQRSLEAACVPLLAASTTHVLIEAYDHEGYVLMRRGTDVTIE